MQVFKMDYNSYKVETMDILESFSLNVSFDPKINQIVSKINDCIFETRRYDYSDGLDVDQWFEEQLEEEIKLYKISETMDKNFPKLSLHESHSYVNAAASESGFNSTSYIVSRFQSILKKFPRGCLLGAFKKLTLMIKLAEKIIHDAKSVMRVRWKLIFPIYEFLIADNFVTRFYDVEPLGWTGFLKNPIKMTKVKLTKRIQLKPRKLAYDHQDSLEHISESLDSLSESDSMPLSC